MSTNILRDEILSLATKLVSVNSISGEEGPCAKILLEYFSAKGVNARLEEVQPGRWNVVAHVPGTNPTLLFNGHTDMVDVVDGWTTPDPFKLETKGDWMIGAGLANMKGALTAQAVATALVASSDETHSEIIFTGVVGECSDLGVGTLKFLENGGAADFAIVGEPTSLLAQTSHTGTYQARIDFTGVPVHIGDYEPGFNAVEAASEFVLGVRDTTELPQGSGLFEGTPMAMAGQMSGGFYPQIAAPSSSVWVDVRAPSGTTQDALENHMDAVAARSIHSSRSSWRRTTLGYAPAYSMAPVAIPLLETLENVFAQVTGNVLKRGFANPGNRFFFTDAAHLEAGGIPSLVFGPGKWVPGPDEKISIEDVSVFANLLNQFAHSTVRK